ncbi:S8 family serine peptidase, partial [candidate division WOR-3 bacterium]|nr:S8 family serine peptidase [candidate division WOR-3 bacterium]
MKRLITVMLLLSLLLVFTGAKQADTNVYMPEMKVTEENITARYENPIEDFKPLYKGKMLTKTVGNPDIIKLGFYSIDVKQGEPKLNADLMLKDVKGGSEYYIIQFKGKASDNYKETIRSYGAEIEWPLKNNAILVKMEVNKVDEINGLSIVNWVSLYHPAYKVNPNWIDSKTVETKDMILRLHKTADMDNAIEQLNNLGVEIYERSGESSVIKVIGVRTTLDKLSEISKITEVFSINEGLKNYPHNDDGRTIMMESSTTVADTCLWEHGIYGEGEIINVTDSGITMGHYAFYDAGVTLNDWGHYPTHRKVIAYLPAIPSYIDTIDFGDEPGPTGLYHGTHTSGTTAGNDAPNASSSYDGIAKSAKIFFLDAGNAEDEWLYVPYDIYSMFDTMYQHGVKITSNSYGSYNDTVRGAYMDASQMLDAFTWDHKDFTACYSSGNDGSGAQTISPTPSAKNVVAVGSHSESAPNSISNFSSRGPTEDGRWGVTILAPGETVMSADGSTSGAGSDYVNAQGTSMSCPFAAGATALIRDWLKQGFYPTGTAQAANAVTNPSSALLRALLINSAEDMGQTVPNNNIGFGRVTLYNVCFMNDVSPKAIALHDAQDGLLDGEYVEYQFNVTANAVDLKVSLVWTDYPYPFTGYNNAMQDSVIMNDLDLIVTDPSSTVYNLNDVINTLEQHIFTTPEVGVWTVRVYAKDIVVAPQPYALVVTYDVDNAFNG